MLFEVAHEARGAEHQEVVLPRRRPDGERRLLLPGGRQLSRHPGGGPLPGHQLLPAPLELCRVGVVVSVHGRHHEPCPAGRIGEVQLRVHDHHVHVRSSQQAPDHRPRERRMPQHDRAVRAQRMLRIRHDLREEGRVAGDEGRAGMRSGARLGQQRQGMAFGELAGGRSCPVARDHHGARGDRDGMGLRRQGARPPGEHDLRALR